MKRAISKKPLRDDYATDVQGFDALQAFVLMGRPAIEQIGQGGHAVAPQILIAEHDVV